MNVRCNLGFLKHLIQDTFRQAVASGIFWMMLVVTAICVVFCLSVDVSGDVALHSDSEPVFFLPQPPDHAVIPSAGASQAVRLPLEIDPDTFTVEIKGVDVYNPTTGEIRSSGTGDIALWMIDTDYDEESFFVRHCYFTGDNDPYKRLKAALKADIDPEAWETLYRTKSRPFRRPEKGKIAVKVINHYGDEVLQVYEV